MLAKLILNILFVMIFSSLKVEAISLLQDGGMSQNTLNNNPRGLIESYKARKVGDLITVKVTENISAIKKSEMETSNSTSHAADITSRQAATKTTSLDPSNNNVTSSITHFEVPVSYGKDNKRKVSVNNSETFTSLVSALIVEIDPATGNMVVEGSRQIVMEGEMKSLYLRGIANPKDIDSNNEIPSYKLANAQVQIVGSGALTKDRDSGFIQKILRKIF